MTLAHAMPQLEFRPPLCPFCDEDLNYEDGWGCGDCQLYWCEGGRFAERANPDEPICDAEHRPFPPDYDIEPLRACHYRCVLDQGHELPHRGVRVDQGTEETYTWYEPKTAVNA